MTGEPTIAVGLVEDAGSVSFQLADVFSDADGRLYPPGEYLVICKDGALRCTGAINGEFASLVLSGASPQSRFSIEVVIGIGFHWQQRRKHTFNHTLRLIPRPGDLITLINDVPLESYILSVSCSEMSAGSPEEFLKAHSIISRSWVLAQLIARQSPPVRQILKPVGCDVIIRWYDRQAHSDFDVCADDHCQRYQGIDMVAPGIVSRAIEQTRGQVLMHGGKPCDARFSKCCGGVTEDFSLAWDDIAHPYLVPVVDGPQGGLPNPPLTDELAARNFILSAPEAYCNCRDATIIDRILNNYDRSTGDFFRWRVRLTPGEIAGFIARKLSLDLGRIVALEPLERGRSARLKLLRLVGEKRSVVIGKELEIRRALSPTHLYSSAFTIDVEGPKSRPDAFVLSGAGWGHGVGLCQIGAAVMASMGVGYREILRHYYPGSVVESIY